MVEVVTMGGYVRLPPFATVITSPKRVVTAKRIYTRTYYIYMKAKYDGSGRRVANAAYYGGVCWLWLRRRRGPRTEWRPYYLARGERERVIKREGETVKSRRVRSIRNPRKNWR